MEPLGEPTSPKPARDRRLTPKKDDGHRKAPKLRIAPHAVTSDDGAETSFMRGCQERLDLVLIGLLLLREPNR